MGTRFSTRTMFLVVSFLTLVLLLGSVMLQRIVFKADQVTSALFLSPVSSSFKPGSSTAVRVQASFAGTATVAAAQLSLSFDPSVIEVTATTATNDWNTKKVETTNGTLNWVLVPAVGSGSVAEFSGEVTIGEIVFKAITEGKVVLDSTSAQTRIVAVDPGQTPSMYNSITNTQTVTLTISNSASAVSPKASPLPDAAAKQTASELQHFQSINEVTGISATELLITTAQPSAISVLFGPDPQTLLNTVVANTSATNSAIRLSNLEADSRYYYQVRSENGSGDSLLSKVRSFKTSPTAAVGSVTTAEISAFPTLAQKNSTIYVVGKNNDGSVLADLKPTLSVESGAATVGVTAGSGGIFRTVISSKLATKQTVGLLINSGSQTIGRTTITFDPNLPTPLVKAAPELTSNLPLNSSTFMVLLVLSGLLVLLGYSFYRLAKAK